VRDLSGTASGSMLTLMVDLICPPTYSFKVGSAAPKLDGY
jgi:hypothetical protein